MLKTLIQLLGKDAPIFRRYVWMVVFYGVLCGLTITLLAPVLTHLLNGEIKEAATWLLVLLVGVFVCWAFRRSIEQAGVRVGVAILQGARHRLGEHIARLPVGWFTPQNTAQLSHLVTHGMMSVAQLPAHVFTPVITGMVTPVILIAALFALYWPLGLIALMALPLLVGILTFTAWLSQQADAAYNQSFADTSQRVVEFTQTQSVLRAFNGEGGGTYLLEQAVEQQYISGGRLIWQSAGSAVLNAWAVQTVFAILFMTAVLWMNNHLGGPLQVQDVVAMIVALLLVGRFVESLLEVVGYGEVLRSARGQLDAIHELFTVKPQPEPDTPQTPHDASIELRDVYFRYVAEESDVLRGLNLCIAPGSMTALIGESGSGKTTLARLIARFFDVNKGSVLIGGVDVRQIPSVQLAGQISQIFQDNYLFAGSIADNIRLGKPDASDAQLSQAVRLAGLDEIVTRLPQGLDTSVGEGGVRLSGGERQRIAIARALIKDAPILLVDEATAALDAENQAVIAQTLMRLRGQRTLVVIAHQLSTVAMADQIVVLKDGEIVEQGTPTELSESQGALCTVFESTQGCQRMAY